MREFLGHPMPYRTTQESYRPRVSDRTMVANLVTVTLVSSGNEWRRREREHETHWDGESHRLAAARRVRTVKTKMSKPHWGWMHENTRALRWAGRNVS
jgi:hypothetical protein